jgi:nucleoside-diphosphate-sugar epimerase
MSILITGNSGFLGRSIGSTLDVLGEDVIGVDVCGPTVDSGFRTLAGASV